MTPEMIVRMREKLERQRTDLQALSQNASESRKPVELDQQLVGRLSRQDALQQQAMANAQEARRANEIRKIDDALARIEASEFGWCVECGEKIVEKRLEIDPTTRLCIKCASGH